MTIPRGIGILLVFSAALGQNSQPSAPALRSVEAQQLQSLRAQHEGKVLVLNFWATWCKPCIEELPDFVKLQKKYAPNGVAVLFVSIDEDDDRSKRKAVSLLRKHNASLPSLIKKSGDDEEFINAVHPQWSGALPATFIYDRRGKLVLMKVEETSFSELEKTVTALLR